jgi:diguanylate cyclase (GGDEF)-like protein/PAS domain S-box-containing protein
MAERKDRRGNSSNHCDPISAADVWAWEWKLQADELTLHNQGITANDGPQELPQPELGQSLFQVMHPDDRSALYDRLEQHLKNPDLILRAFVRIKAPDNKWSWLLIRGRLVSRTSEGLPEMLAGLAIDQTEEREAEEKMRNASLYARSLLEASLDPLVTIGIDGRIMDVNRATELATGLARTNLIGSDFSDYFTDPEKARAGYQQVFTLGRVVDYPLTLQDCSGQTIDVLYNASTFHDADGRVAGVFATARDVTDAVRSRNELQETNREVMLLSGMSELLQSCQSMNEAMPILQASMEELFPQSQGRGFFANPSTHLLEEALSWGGFITQAITLDPENCWALRRNSIHEVNLGNHLNPACHYLDEEKRPYLCLPLLAQGKALGIIHLITDSGSLNKERFTHLARSTADSISLALANIVLRENLRELSTRDPLTGLYNRRFMEEALSRELSRAGRNNKTGAVAMIDIDHFKAFNDQFGHDAGDAVLIAVADKMKGFRITDLPCRYGGEEFLIVLTDLEFEQAITRMEAFRKEISEITLSHKGHTLPGITVSIGVASFPQRGERASAAIKHADEALYRAKDNGRNQVVAHNHT